ncbi:MAG: keratin [Lachnospiraceae bacterium]
MVADKVKQLEQENISLKAQIEELQNICGTNASVPMNCEYCRNFIQHYIKIDTHYSPIYDGHCVAGKQTKSRRTDDTCKAFVRKAYGKNRI